MTSDVRSSHRLKHWAVVIALAVLWGGWAIVAFAIVPHRATRAYEETLSYYRANRDTALTPASVAAPFLKAAEASQKTQQDAAPWLIATLCTFTLLSASCIAYYLRGRAATLHVGQVVLMWAIVFIAVWTGRFVFDWLMDGPLDGLQFRTQVLIVGINFALPVAVLTVSVVQTWYWFGARART